MDKFDGNALTPPIPTLAVSLLFDADVVDVDDVVRAMSEREGRSDCDIDRRLMRPDGGDSLGLLPLTDVV